MASLTKVRQGVWRVRWRFGGTRDGQAQTKTFRVYGDATAFQRAVEQRGHRVRRDDPDVLDLSIIRPDRETRHTETTGPTFGAVAAEWLETRNLRPQSRSAYDGVLHKSLLPRWGDLPVSTITQRDLRSLIEEHGIEQGGRGVHLWTLTKATIRHAHAMGYRPDNPTAGLRLPERTEDEVPLFLTHEQVGMLLVAAGQGRQYGLEWVLFCRTALDSGLRHGELVGLQVRDLDLRNPAKPKLRVRRQMKRGEQVPLKSKTSKRDVVIEPELADDLRALVGGRPATAPLFPGPKGGHLSQSTVGARWRFTVARAMGAGLEVEPRFHDLRHTHASFLLESGVSLLEVSERLGHRDITVTARYYGHIGPSSDERVLKALRTRRLQAV